MIFLSAIGYLIKKNILHRSQGCFRVATLAEKVGKGPVFIKKGWKSWKKI